MMRSISISSSKHTQMINIAGKVQSLIPAGFCGICHLFCTHTTAGLTVNENADDDVQYDMLYALERCVPWKDPQYGHMEGNSAAHVKASMMGFDLTLPVQDGRLVLGTWQGVYFCEFDGPRSRRVLMTLLPEASTQISAE